jgi:hypothetical protein
MAKYPDHPTIEGILEAHRAALGKDFAAYRNHVYRVYWLSLCFAETEDDPGLAVAAAFHDLGIWTAATWDYLPPSKIEAKAWLLAEGREDLTGRVETIIEFHHKIGPYTGKYASSVEAFRRADWVDVLRGLRYGKTVRQKYRELVKAFPYRGFHGRLVVFFFRNLLRNPLKPLPMMR